MSAIGRTALCHYGEPFAIIYQYCGLVYIDFSDISINGFGGNGLDRNHVQ